MALVIGIRTFIVATIALGLALNPAEGITGLNIAILGVYALVGWFVIVMFALTTRERFERSQSVSASFIQGGTLINEDALTVRRPDFGAYGDMVDEARRRIADDSLPEHAVQADQYIPALVCELAAAGPVCLVTADTKLRSIVRDVTARWGVDEAVRIADPRSVL